MGKMIGESVKRVEDQRFITKQGNTLMTSCCRE